MAISIEKENIFKTYTVPLIGGIEQDWKDNSWLISQLRSLANLIEKENPDIFKIGFTVDGNYKSPALNIICIK